MQPAYKLNYEAICGMYKPHRVWRWQRCWPLVALMVVLALVPGVVLGIWLMGR